VGTLTLLVGALPPTSSSWRSSPPSGEIPLFSRIVMLADRAAVSPPQPFQQQRYRPAGANVSDDSTHGAASE
jgi:hypothetical protein